MRKLIADLNVFLFQVMHSSFWERGGGVVQIEVVIWVFISINFRQNDESWPQIWTSQNLISIIQRFIYICVLYGS